MQRRRGTYTLSDTSNGSIPVSTHPLQQQQQLNDDEYLVDQCVDLKNEEENEELEDNYDLIIDESDGFLSKKCGDSMGLKTNGRIKSLNDMIVEEDFFDYDKLGFKQQQQQQHSGHYRLEV